MKGTVLSLLCAIALAQVGITVSENARSSNDPSVEAQQICKSENNENRLIVHRLCNMFYRCSNGRPYPYKCPFILLYNPVNERCEWPHLVECRDRAIADDDSSSNDSDSVDENDEGSHSDNDSGNDNDDNNIDGDDNVGTCNCNPGEAPSICAEEGSGGVLVAHENCNQFYKCDHGKPVGFTCPPRTLYNPSTEECDWASNVVCGDRVIPSPDDDDTGNDSGNNENDNNSSGNDNEDNDNGGTCNCDPGEAPTICAQEGSNGVLVAHENCNQFYKCDHGKTVVFTCPLNTLYNPHKEQCDWTDNVDCADRVILDPDVDDTGNDSGSNDNDNNSSGNESDANEDSGTCNCNPGEAPSICAQEDSNGVLVAHENCNQFYKCDHGNTVVFTCPLNTLYNPHKEQCDWTDNVDCADRVIPDPDDDDTGNDSGSNDNDNNSSGNESHGNEDGGTCNCNPGEAPSICAQEDSNGVLVAHENCNQFFKCDHGQTVVFTCPLNTLYNPHKEQCDWADNVDCTDRVIPDPDGDDTGNDSSNNDNDNNSSGNENDGNDDGGTCNCNPGEAPSICAQEGSNGVLVAHENCNQFYKCDYGKPVVFTCPLNTLYNPHKEQCDWTDNVDCADRVIPDPDDVDTGNDSSNNDNDNNSSGNENDGNDNGGTCNCNPGEAPSICAQEGSNGVLVAHENCNQFFKCDHGQTVVFTCPLNTLYNPHKEQCDWADNVDCTDRVIPDPDSDDTGNDSDNNVNDNSSSENDNNDNDNGSTCNCNPGEAPSICASSNSDGYLIAHENCNQFYMCSNRFPVALKCPANTLYNPYKERCDWASKVNCGDRVIPNSEENNKVDDNSNIEDDEDDNNIPINDDPSQAAAICAGIDADGALVTHEKCNKFYQCSGGLPITIRCPEELLFNPATRQCDWPRNVDCSDRIYQQTL